MVRCRVALRSDFAAALLCIGAMIGWNVCETHSLSWAIAVFFASFVPASLVVGGWIVRFLTLGIPEDRDFPMRFLAGFFVVNTTLCLLALLTPIPIAASAAGLIVLVATVEVAKRWKRVDLEEGETKGNHIAGLICVALAILGSTIWSRESLTSEVPCGDVTIFKPWVDGFCHAFILSRVAAPGVPRDCIWGSGHAFGPYHFGSYAVPAVLTKISNTSPYQAFAGTQAPLGLLLLGLAAFVLVKSWWGPWPGLAASAFIFMPDAAWLGVQNYWFSFHWLLQVGPALAYGIAIAAFSWMLMFRGCQTGSKRLALASFLAQAFCVLYKYHIFIANALLIWLFPAFFMASWPWKKRVGWFCFALTTYLAVIHCSNRFLAGRAPPIWLDGSALKTWMPFFVTMIEVEKLKLFFSRFTVDSSMPHDIFWGALLLVVCVFGFLAAGWIAFAVLLGKRAGRRELLFPIFIVLNYLAMTLGLPNNTGEGGLDEMAHRPFVWAYFVMAAWVGGAAYFYFFENRPPRKRWVAAVLFGVFFIGLVAPMFSRRVVQQGPAQEWSVRYSRIPVPTGQVDCCRYVREHGCPEDILQDSKFDPKLVSMGLAGLRAYVSRTDVYVSPPYVIERVENIDAWLKMREEEKIQSFASKNDIRWLILHPGDGNAWPAAALDRCVYQSGGYRVFRF